MNTETPTTRCPVAGCEFGSDEPKRFRQVADHVVSEDDDGHRRARRTHDWSYEYEQIE